MEEITIIVDETIEDITILVEEVAGPAGESTYQYEVRVNGFTGTEAEYYDQLDSKVAAAEAAKDTATAQAQISTDKAALSAGHEAATLALKNDVIQLKTDTQGIYTATDQLKTDVTGLKNTTEGFKNTAETKAGEAAASATSAANSIASLEYEITILDNATLLSTGTNQFTLTIPSNLNGKSLSSVQAAVNTVSSSGLPTFTVRNLTTGNTLLSTPATINVSAYNSYAATTPSVVNPTYKVVSTGDRLAIDCTVAGTGTTGLTLILKFVP